MSTERILADWDCAEDVGVLPSTAPVAWFCPECGEPQYVGAPDDRCVGCGGFDWLAERDRGWAT